MGLFVLCSIVLAGMGVDFITSFTAVASAIGNVGPGFANVGPSTKLCADALSGQVAADMVHDVRKA